MESREFVKLNREQMIIAFNHLKDDYAQLFVTNYDLQQRIDKAITYISNINSSKVCSNFNPYLDDLLLILKDKEESQC